jgi:predicted kinase
MSPQGTIHLLCGLPGTGKSTFARELESRTNGVTLNHDVWLVGIFGPTASEDFEKHHSTVWRLLWQLAERLVSIGVDVILDFGLWHRCERDDFRERAAKIHAPCRLYFVTCSLELQFRRIDKRNSEVKDKNTIISPAMLTEFCRQFEVPAAEEGATVINTDG